MPTIMSSGAHLCSFVCADQPFSLHHRTELSYRFACNPYAILQMFFITVGMINPSNQEAVKDVTRTTIISCTISFAFLSFFCVM